MTKLNTTSVCELPETKQWLIDAAEQGEGYAHWKLALANLEGSYGEADLNLACQHLRQAISHGIHFAPMALAELIISGAVAPEGDETILGLLEKGAAMGHLPTVRAAARYLMLGSSQDFEALNKARQYLKTAEWNGCTQSLIEATYIDALGLGITPSNGESQLRVKRAGRGGNAVATHCYGLMMYHGYPFPGTQENALELLEEAIRQGADEASIDIYLHADKVQGFVVKPSVTKAFEHLLLAKNPRAMLVYAERLFKSQEIMASRTGENYLWKCISKDYGPAFIPFAERTWNQGYEENQMKAVEILEYAKSLGMYNSIALKLGHCAKNIMTESKKHDPRLFAHMREAAQHDDHLALLVGHHYSELPASAERSGTSKFWYLASILDGSADAGRMIGFEIRKSSKIAGEDNALAMKFFEYSAVQGSTYACALLADEYMDGSEFVLKNPREAVRWHYKGALMGYKYCQSKLGWCYANAIGVPGDMTKASFWDNLSNLEIPFDERVPPPPLYSADSGSESESDLLPSVLIPFKKTI